MVTSSCDNVILVVSSCTGTQRNETLTNCVTTPCMDIKTIGIPPCTGTPGQPRYFIEQTRAEPIFNFRFLFLASLSKAVDAR